jgi:hypothetical protein
MIDELTHPMLDLNTMLRRGYKRIVGQIVYDIHLSVWL